MAEKIPDIVVGRLPKYLQALIYLQQAGQKTTSSQEMGDKVGISAAQIRKDLSLFGEFGKQGTGYSIPFLVDQLQQILKVNRGWDVVLVGAGDLGHAIGRYAGFSNRGFRIVMVFDNNPQKVGKKIGEHVVQDIAEMETKIRAANVEIAMLTVPAAAAQEAAEALVRAGVRAILNYAPITLSVPDTVRVEAIDPILRLQHMTYYL
jgi:redox-sensing transcriptional repressor